MAAEAAQAARNAGAVGHAGAVEADEGAGNATVTARRRSPRSTREAVIRREDGQRDLIAALLGHADPVRRDLANRLRRCQQAREARRGWLGPGRPAPGGYPYPYLCRLYSCSECHRGIVRRWEDAARRRFENAENAGCSTVTVVLARAAGIEAVRGVVAKARKDIGNMRAAMRRQPGGWRWRSLLAFGMVEVEAVVPGDGAALPAPGRGAPLAERPAAGSSNGVWWLARARLAVHHPHLDRAELARAAMGRWPGAERVEVRPFGGHRPAGENAADVVWCALEGFGQTGVHRVDAGWPRELRADFHAWLFGLGRGLQPLGMSLRPRLEQRPSRLDDAVDRGAADPWVWSGWRDGEIEPMPVVF